MSAECSPVLQDVLVDDHVVEIREAKIGELQDVALVDQPTRHHAHIATALVARTRVFETL